MGKRAPDYSSLQTATLLRSPTIQRLALLTAQRHPQFARGQNPGLAFLGFLYSLADESRNKEAAKVLGLPTNASRETILNAAWKAIPELGDTRDTVNSVLGSMATIYTADSLAVRQAEADAEMESKTRDPLPPLSEHAKAEVDDAAERRALIERRVREAEGARPASQRALDGAVASSSLSVDIHRAMNARQGLPPPKFSAMSDGPARWRAEHPDRMEVEWQSRRDEELRSEALAERAQEEAFASDLRDSVEEATEAAAAEPFEVNKHG